MEVVKIIQWDMGHRVMNHRSICKGLHGHRYKAEISIKGDLVDVDGVSEEGMVIDFSDIKKLSLSLVHSKLDHSFMVWEKDKEMIDFFDSSDGHKPVVVPFTPTVENVAKYIFDILSPQIIDKYGNGIYLSSIKVWETPTSFAIYSGK
tara:strand:- start:315 stop:758 length:444 start_codon:yes stop_codon:yes gene_type:complete